MALATEFLIFAIVALVIGYLLGQRKPKNFPPGPWGFPLIGHIPLLGLEGHKTAIQWKSKYGPVVGIDFASSRCVIISDYKLVKDAMNDNAFAGRPLLPYVLDRSGGQKAEGIIFTEGREWLEQRRFALRRLRDFGFGTRSMEAIVQDEIQELIENFKQHTGSPISTMNKFNVAVVNALWSILTGERFKQNDPELNKIIQLITQGLDGNSIRKMLSYLVPWFSKYMPDFISQHSEITKADHATKAFLQPYIDSHFKTHTPSQPRDFLDTYIDEMKSTEDPTSSFHISKKNPILMTLLDLFFAGVETTSTTLTWICLYMARNQHVQDKLFEEIQKVVGNSRLPGLNDRISMPYTEAVIHEVMRKATLVPLNVMHSTTEDVHFHGYNIPKDTAVMTNLYEIHNNVELWGDPENFRPERFLSKDESKFVRQEGFMAFSTGKRVCLGETLARDELFLFTTSLFQVFQVSTDPFAPPPTLEGSIGDVMMTRPHKLVFSLRH